MKSETRRNMILFANCESKQKRKIKIRFSVDYTCIQDRRHSVEPTYMHIRHRTWWYNEKKNVKVKHTKVPHMSQGTHSIYWQCLSLFAFNLFLCRTLDTPAANLFFYSLFIYVHVCVSVLCYISFGMLLPFGCWLFLNAAIRQVIFNFPNTRQPKDAMHTRWQHRTKLNWTKTWQKVIFHFLDGAQYVFTLSYE